MAHAVIRTTQLDKQLASLNPTQRKYVNKAIADLDTESGDVLYDGGKMGLIRRVRVGSIRILIAVQDDLVTVLGAGTRPR